jgi:hypothetical protein
MNSFRDLELLVTPVQVAIEQVVRERGGNITGEKLKVVVALVLLKQR